MEPKKPREARAERLAIALKKLERSWHGKQVGIGFECDTETGEITVSVGAVGEPAYTFNVSADIDDISVGQGDPN
jgi:hypothetical protein